MMRIKLFALFIAFALLALVGPRKCLELLEAADRGAAPNPGHVPPRPMPTPRQYPSATDERLTREHARWRAAQECPRPPAGWRCTRRAGHDGPCAAVVK